MVYIVVTMNDNRKFFFQAIYIYVEVPLHIVIYVIQHYTKYETQNRFYLHVQLNDFLITDVFYFIYYIETDHLRFKVLSLY